MRGQLTVIHVDFLSPAGEALKADFGVRFTPTFLLFDAQGEEQLRLIGTFDAAAIRELVVP